MCVLRNGSVDCLQLSQNDPLVKQYELVVLGDKSLSSCGLPDMKMEEWVQLCIDFGE